MRNPYLKKFLAVFVLLFSLTVLKAQTTKEELVLQVPSIHPERNLATMTTQLSSLGGVEYVAFCPDQQLMILRIDRKVHLDDKNVLNAFTSNNYTVHVKIGVPANEIMDKCNNLIVPDPQNVPVDSSAD